jgi:gliding motility-associated-like protein
MIYPYNNAFSQNPGGVVGSSIWLKADANIITSGTDVIQWNDNSGNGYNFIDVGATPYLYLPNQGNFNPGVNNPDGTNRRLENTTGIGLLTVILVTNPDYNHRHDNPFSEVNADTNFIRVYGNGAWRAPRARGGFGGDAGVPGERGTVWFNGRANSISEPAHGNRTNLIIVEAFKERNMVPGIELGDTKNDRFWHGDIFELIAFNSRLSITDRNKIESYLCVKYGVSMIQSTPKNYLASDGTVIWNAADANNTYIYGIAGIGRDDNSALNQKQSRSVEPGTALTIGLGTIASDNASNSNTFGSDINFLIWASDNASLGEVTADLPINITSRIEREWKINETGIINDVQVQINTDSISVIEANLANFELLIDQDGDGDFTTGEIIKHAFADRTGNIITFNNVNFNNGDVFTFGTSECSSIDPDLTEPVFTFTPANITQDIDELSCDAVVFWTEPRVNDDCAVTLTSTHNPGDAFSIGTTTVTYTATDAAGNTANSSFDIIIIDNIVPTTNWKDITIQLDATGNATIVASDIDNGSSDNCTFTLSADKTSFNCTNIGANTVILTARDASANTSLQTATVTVEDNIVPEVVTKDITIQLDATGNATIVASDIDNGSSDNCSFTLFADKTSFNCTNIGANTVILTARDASGNTSSQIATVTVEDNIVPEVVTKDITIQLDPTGNVSIAKDEVNNGSYDACGGLVFDTDITTFNCSNVGPNTVILSVTDVNGNTSSQTATVTVEDNIVPAVITKDITVQLDATGNATILASDIDNGSSDNCTFTLSADKTSFNCTNIGANTVTLTVTDAGVNSSSQTAIVTVEDNINPTIICPGDITAETDVGQDYATGVNIGSATVTDNCGVVSVTNNAPTRFNLGTTIVIWTVTDNAGNFSTCEQNVIVTKLDENNKPIAQGDIYSIFEDATLSANILENDFDTDNHQITLFEISTSVYAQVEMSTNGDIVYTPNQNYFGTDSLTYVIYDSGTPRKYDTSLVKFNILPVNDAPIVNDMALHFNNYGMQQICLDANDIEDDNLNISDFTDLLNVLKISTTYGSLCVDITFDHLFLTQDTLIFTVCDDGSPEMCSAIRVVVTHNLQDELQIFDGISPDGDGENDNWQIIGIENYPNNEIQIFDRWGNVVYRVNGYNNVDVLWNGQINSGIRIGDKVPKGTYFYLIYLEEGQQTISGYVVVNY